VTEKKNGEKIGMDCNDTMNMTYFVLLVPLLHLFLFLFLCHFPFPFPS